jgi:hypothetical protein
MYSAEGYSREEFPARVCGKKEPEEANDTKRERAL